MPAPARAFPLVAIIHHFAEGEGTDEYGNPVLEEVGTEEVRCNLQPQWSRENTANQDQQSESFNLYLPAGVALSGHDRVSVGGVQHEVFGTGMDWSDFAGVPHHVEATLRRVV